MKQKSPSAERAIEPETSPRAKPPVPAIPAKRGSVSPGLKHTEYRRSRAASQYQGKEGESGGGTQRGVAECPKPQVFLDLNLVTAPGDSAGPCSSGSNGNTTSSSSGSRGLLQQRPLSAVTELHLALLGPRAKAPAASATPGMSQPTLRVFRLPEPAVSEHQQTK